MKYIIFVLMIGLISCGKSKGYIYKDITYVDKNSFMDVIVSDLKPPVILISKSRKDYSYIVVLKDGDNRITTISDAYDMAKTIGDCYMPKDTILYKK